MKSPAQQKWKRKNKLRQREHKQEIDQLTKGLLTATSEEEWKRQLFKGCLKVEDKRKLHVAEQAAAEIILRDFLDNPIVP